ncbi:transposase [Streptomyces xanthophaeus]|uniref:transposase n=1 Tax=Streptomyces xanthophaeus TaxID=67385 RepID=UPI0035712557
MGHGRVIRRHKRSDAGWQLVQPLLPRSVLGRPRLDDRTILNGIVWKFRTGVAWRGVPDRYGSGASLHTRFRRWAADGTFERMLQAAQAGKRHRVAGVGGFHRPCRPARGRGPRRGSAARPSAGPAAD